MKPDIDYTLYLVTDRDLMNSPTVEESVERAVTGGCTIVQLREKNVSSRVFYDTALQVRHVTNRLGVPLIINDRTDIALAVDADGVHVGQDDLPARQARRLIGPDRILGVSVQDRAEALAATDEGADYLGVGAINPTATKTNAGVTTIGELRRIRHAVSCPIVAIGGINANTVRRLAGTGIDGIAAISAIVGHKDMAGATHELKALFLGQ